MNAPPNSFLSSFQRLFRQIACILVPTSLVLVAAIVLSWQFTEITSRQEILSLTSFLVIMSLSALAFNWSRATHTFVNEIARQRIYNAGVDLFLASLLALVASCFAWLQSTPEVFQRMGVAASPNIQLAIFWIHWAFLCLSLLMTLGAIMSAILAIGRAEESPHHSEHVTR